MEIAFCWQCIQLSKKVTYMELVVQFTIRWQSDNDVILIEILTTKILKLFFNDYSFD